MPCQRTHDLDKLLLTALPVEPLWSALLPVLLRLDRYAVRVRHPGEEAAAENAKDSIKDARAVRKEARLALGLAA